METPILETTRLMLRPMTPADAEHIYRTWTSDPEVARYMMWELHRSVRDTLDWLEEEDRNRQSDTAYDWGFVLRETGTLFGSGGLYWNKKHGCFELGYCTAKAYWGHGYATEAGRAMLDFGRETLRQTMFHACHAVENVRSGRVIAKLGFVYDSDGTYDSVSGARHFKSRQYFLRLAP